MSIALRCFLVEKNVKIRKERDVFPYIYVYLGKQKIVKIIGKVSKTVV